MPSPFPGMDPYLESPHWLGFHNAFVNRIAWDLSPRLPPHYVAIVTERLGAEDLAVEVRAAGTHELVTAIEVLSPRDKAGVGRDEYLKRRESALSSGANLVEIDLLIRGHRVPMKDSLPNTHYCAIVCRAIRREVAYNWAFSLRDRLPNIFIPLRGNDADIVGDLGCNFTTVYDHFRYGDILDYSQPPEVGLVDKDRQWIQQQLRAAELAWE